jgi:hypothetical protein
MSAHPVRSYTDHDGVGWLMLSNGARIRLPEGGGGGEPGPPGPPGEPGEPGPAGPPGTGVTDHGALSGLADDDHTQYVLNTGDTMTGTLNLIINQPPGGPNLYMSKDTFPALFFLKNLAPVDRRTWEIYLDGAAGLAPNLAFTVTDDSGAGVTPPMTIRMREDGRLSVGADPINVEDVVTQGYLIGAGWQIPSMLNGWVSDSGTPVRYRRSGSGLVSLQGIVKSGTVGANAFQLATGYRPQSSLDFGTICSGNVSARVKVFTDGYVQVVALATGGSNAWVATNVTFYGV